MTFTGLTEREKWEDGSAKENECKLYEQMEKKKKMRKNNSLDGVCSTLKLLTRNIHTSHKLYLITG